MRLAGPGPILLMIQTSDYKIFQESWDICPIHIQKTTWWRHQARDIEDGAMATRNSTRSCISGAIKKKEEAEKLIAYFASCSGPGEFLAGKYRAWA